MKLSIIIPTYNSAKTIQRALDSIIAQTFTDYEVLIMDGLSKDNTIALCQSYKDSRINIYSEKDNGIYDAMNKGIKKAQGDWLYFLGSDDYLYANDSLEKVFYYEKADVHVMYGDVESIILDNNYSGEWSLDSLVWNRCHQGIFYRNVIFERFGGYDTKYPVLADYVINVQWFLSKRVKSQYLPLVIANFSEGGMSNSDNRKNDPLFFKDFHWIVLRNGFWQMNNGQRKTYLLGALNNYSWFRILLNCYLSIRKKAER